jgi:hypothetical protein
MKRNRIVEWLFHKDSMILCFVFVSFWFTVSLAIPQFIDQKDLDHHVGRITDAGIYITRIKNKLLSKDTSWQMRFFLQGKGDYYILPGNNGYHQYDSLYITDSVEVFTKGKTWGIFGFDSRLVYHMVRKTDQRVFVDLAKEKNKNSGLWLMTGIFMLIFLLWYASNTVRRMQ